MSPCGGPMQDSPEPSASNTRAAPPTFAASACVVSRHGVAAAGDHDGGGGPAGRAMIRRASRLTSSWSAPGFAITAPVSSAMNERLQKVVVPSRPFSVPIRFAATTGVRFASACPRVILAGDQHSPSSSETNI